MSAKARHEPHPRVVYVSPVDSDAKEGEILVGSEAQVAEPAPPLEPEEKTENRNAPGGPGADRSTGRDQWLRENVPPHW